MVRTENIVYIILFLFFINIKCERYNFATTSYGVPLTYKDASATVGSNGPLVLEDVEFLDEMSHFNRERIPNRVVHGKGVGARGYFEVTNDITKYCAAKLFSSIGKKTSIFVRFSAIGADPGSPDTSRDVRGFSVKFYTKDGIWDLVGNNFPVFFVRDPILFPSLIHAQRKDAATNLLNSSSKWDFYTLRPETTHTLMWLYSDLGIPYTLRHMNGYGVNTFKLINTEGDYVYCKFHFLSQQGLRNLTVNQAAALRSCDPDYYQRDMWNAIEKGDYPSWNFFIQIITQRQAVSIKMNPLDATKIWPEDDYPLIKVGRIVLTTNPTNYFKEVEQIAFSPSRMVPGIRPTVDRLLQGRFFAYSDAQLYRLGTNYLQLPINGPFRIRNFERDGSMTYYNQGRATNYHPNSFDGPNGSYWAKHLMSPYYTSGVVNKYDNGEDDNFSQAKMFYKHRLDDKSRKRLINNLAADISSASMFIQKRAVEIFERVDTNLARTLSEKLKTTY